MPHTTPRICPSPHCEGLSLPGTHALLLHLLKDHRHEDLAIICPECMKGGLKVKGFESHWRKNHSLKPVPHQFHPSSNPSTSASLFDCPIGDLRGHSADFSAGDISDDRGTPIEDSFVGVNPTSSTSSDVNPGLISSDIAVEPTTHGASDERVETIYSDEVIDRRMVEGIIEVDCLDINEVAESVSDEHCSEDQSGIPESSKMVAAQFLLSLRANCGVNDSNVQKVMKETQKLIEHVFDSSVKKLSQLKNLSDDKKVNQVKKEVCNIFSGLQSDYLQKQYFKKSLKVVPLRCINLKKAFVKKGEGPKRKVSIDTHDFYFISVLDVLERLLAHKDFVQMTEKYAHPDPDILDCYSKGKNAKSNEVLLSHPDALLMIIYYDELELATGLGSHASNQQKLGAFYLTLENIHPKYRASLKSICLVGLVNFAYISADPERYTKLIMARIAEDLKKLESGFVFSGKKVYATLISFIGDHAGVHLVCGFKRGFTAKRFCRWCCLTLEETHVCVWSEPENRRTVEQYEVQISEIESSNTLKQRDMKSTEYGLCWRSNLNELKSFHVINGCPPDLMHTLLEGAMARAVRRIIIHCVCELKIVSLAWLNCSLAEFDYGYTEKTEKPSPIKAAHLEKDGNLHQSSAQLWTLAVILPLVVGPLVEEDDQHWENYLQMLEISRAVHTPDIHRKVLPYLNQLVSSYLKGHILLYGHLPAKEHFLIHVAELIEEFGSLVTYNCMRMEANHKIFKKYIHLHNNYINAPKMLALRYSLNQAVNFSRPLIKSAKYGKATKMSVSQLPYASKLSGTDEVVLVTSLETDGLLLKENNCYVCIGFSDETSCPLFAELVNIIVWPKVVLVCKKTVVSHYDDHLSAYEISLMDEIAFFELSHIRGKRVFHVHASGNSKYIAMKECIGHSF